MPTLIAIDQAGGPGFVTELRRIWDDGDAAFPVDQRLTPSAKRDVMSDMRVGEPVEPGDALVVATSGSTGKPKGVVLTHAGVEASARATSALLGVTTDHHWLACLPLSHVRGLSVVTRSLLTSTAVTVPLMSLLVPRLTSRPSASAVSAVALPSVDTASLTIWT